MLDLLKRKVYLDEYSKRSYVVERKAKWYQENKERCVALNKIWLEKHPEYAKKRNKKWNEENKERKKQWRKTEKGKACDQRVASKKRGRINELINTLTADEWTDILIKFQFKCIYCGKKFDSVNIPTVDHIIPVSKGGDNIKENVIPACMSCNAKKNNMLDKEFTQLILKVKKLGPCYGEGT